MNNPLRLVVPLLGIAGVSACTSAAESIPAVEVSDSAGVRIVHSPGPLWVDGEGWRVSSEPSLTIGVLNGPEEYQLVEVADAARQSDGDLVVVDGGARMVRLYDHEGAFVRILGGPGSGPGEFRNPAQVLVTGGDSVAIWDATAYRITRFDSEGSLAGVQTVDLAAVAKAMDPPLYPGAMELLPDGGLLVRLVEKSLGKAGASKPVHVPSGLFRKRSGAMRVAADLSAVDTLMFFGDIEQVNVDAPWGTWPVPPLHAKRTRITHQGNPSRVCIGDQEAPEIRCFGPGGFRTMLRWSSDPTPPTREEMVAWREARLLEYGQKVSEAVVLEMLDQVPLPELRPHYSQITLDAVGNLWVELGPTSGRGSKSVDHFVFDSQGALLGTVALPPIQVLEIGDDYVVGVHYDEYNVEHLQVYEIERK